MNADDEWLYRTDDADRATASIAHTCLMQLAEVYLAYRRVHEDNPPCVVLLDHSLSSMLLSNVERSSLRQDPRRLASRP
jgi:hypothetical protein